MDDAAPIRAGGYLFRMIHAYDPQERHMHEGLPVAGYQPQSDARIALVNDYKETEERLLRSIEQNPDLDHRWAAIAKTDLQKAFMSLNRAVFQPGRIKLPEDDVEPEPEPEPTTP
jgi:hypothetical protein